VSVKRRDRVRSFESHGFDLLREGGNQSIDSDGINAVPIKRHRQLDRITANELCKQARLAPKY